MNDTKKLVFFASGAGSNVLNILNYFGKNGIIQPALIVTNKSDAGVVAIGKEYGVEVQVVSKEELNEGSLCRKITKIAPALIILAGFLLKIPGTLIALFPDKIINIHPSLLPKYGGKGMYGRRVHRAVFENKEAESGITIHYVNEAYDEGEILFQSKVKLSKQDIPATIEQKVRELEKKHLPKIIEQLLNTNEF